MQKKKITHVPPVGVNKQRDVINKDLAKYYGP